MSMIVHGTEDRSTDPIPVVVGDWSLLLIGGAVRVIRWRGVEVVRGIDCPIRDATWGTLVQEDVAVSWHDNGVRRVMTRTFAVGDGAVRGRMVMNVDPAGTLEVDVRLEARDVFRTNRSGITVLHPIRGVAGMPVTVHKASGGSEAARFPIEIMPSQPVFDIAGLEHVVDGIRVAIAFEGETFEMEDQRNWADASYKTYCRPLSRPMPYEIVAGDPIHHRVRLTVSGHRETVEPAVGGYGSGGGAPFPEVLVVAEEGWVPERGHPAHEVGVGKVVIRLGPRQNGTEAWVVDAARAGTDVDLEVVIPDGADPDAHLVGVATAVRSHGIDPRHVFALPEAYLKSYQPTGQWPTGTSPAEAAQAAGRAFPGARVGVGMLTNFTEVNRCRPPRVGNYVTHSTTAIVHAADDRSVFETLETLPRILADGAAFARGAHNRAAEGDANLNRTVRLGLTAIGSRGNAFGAADAPNRGRVRKAMASADPRQVGLIAAAYAIGVTSRMVEGGVEAFAPSSLGGPFGVASEAGRYPIFFAVQALRRFSGRPTATLPTLPDGAHGIAVVGDAPGSVDAVVANATDGEVIVTLPVGATLRRLDEWSAPTAAVDAGWLDGPRESAGADGAVTLPRYAVVFASWSAGEA
jgi:hypothetical protein